MSGKNPVVHFEMPYEDSDRMVDFYTKAFGWHMQKFGEDMGNYVTAQTTETGEDQRPVTPGAINGGFFPKKPDMRNKELIRNVEPYTTNDFVNRRALITWKNT